MNEYAKLDEVTAQDAFEYWHDVAAKRLKQIEVIREQNTILDRENGAHKKRIFELEQALNEIGAKGAAAIATYGKRDGNGLTGLSRKHYREIGDLLDRYLPPTSTVKHE